jgi:lipopolysaccharide/colanic/teichoic acid biosynthesis glycosyltransferase
LADITDISSLRRHDHLIGGVTGVPGHGPGAAAAGAPDRGRGALYRARGKRAFDLAFILAAAPLVVPLVALLALLVALDGGSPFFTQQRVGRDGRPFRMFKLRTMVPEADAALARILEVDAAAADEWRRHQKLRHDPRITPLGRLLRRTSLDELPQLWNVVRGEMSLVGPRPMMLDQRTLYPGRVYYALRPGVTGLWQISRRHESSFACRADFDDRYLDEMSLTTDVRTIARTCVVVVRGTGC